MSLNADWARAGWARSIARDEQLQRTVAIKVLLRTQTGEGDRRARFLQEARAASTLNHPNIVTIYGVGTEEGRDYLVMEYISGKSLDALIPPVGVGAPLRLTNGTEYASAPAWSPDGTSIVFLSSTLNDEELEARGGTNANSVTRVVMFSALGGTARELASFENPLLGLSWSVDGKSVFVCADNAVYAISGESKKRRKIVDAPPNHEYRSALLSDQGGSTEVWMSNADGYEMAQVTTLKGNGAGGARWSPDGQQIVFLSNVDGQWEIFMVDAQGGTPVRITNNPAHDTAPVWSPDGKWIYFASNRSGAFEIWRTLPKENAAPIQVTHQGGYSAIFSTDGTTMFYCKQDPAKGIWKQTLVDRVPRGDESQVLPVPLSNWGNFDVGRDGIAYVPVERVAKHIYFYRFADKSTTKVFTSTGAPDFGISISPVDGSIVFAQVTKPRRELVLVENFR